MAVAAFYGDDLTGSVDALLQFRRAGLSGVLVTRPDVEVDVNATDVVGIAGTARSLPTGEMDAEVVPALRRLRGHGTRVVQYKACSTVDSAPHTGSIGRVLELAVELFPSARCLSCSPSPMPAGTPSSVTTSRAITTLSSASTGSPP